MLCVCVGDLMDVVFSVCIVRRGAVSAPSVHASDPYNNVGHTIYISIG